ncbi:FAD binding domain-containing protein [Acuticoccus mangrovi]|uniref:FAD binding domain-containing protein n=1 Tax=Acuticoccus mangrovi TaxID=2796142 RepID=A0A934MFA0_9HYPH|nr:FAD binding domain-containing protein [Acuticoccus mangrovi]
MTYLRPTTLDDALAALAGPPVTILAGGTDVFPALGERPAPRPYLDISRVAELRRIEENAAGWRIGATATWTDIVNAPLPAAFDGLKAAAREVGSVQIQNAGTVAGNLCNASPAADGVPALLALGADVEIARSGARRTVPLAEFVTGPRRTALSPGEMVSAILVPPHPQHAVGGFAKLGARRYLVISIAMASAVVVPEAGRAASARVAVGSCGPVASRLPALEDALAGAPLERLAERVAPEHLAPLSAIDDVRGTALYRLDAAATLLARLLGEVGRAALSGDRP